jgi:hypothetical protein
MDGKAFKWFNETHVRSWGEDSIAYLYGSGTDGHFVIILLMCLFFLTLLWLIVHRPDFFTKIVLISWSAVFLIWQCILADGLGSDYVLHGDTLGITIPYYILGPIEQGVILLVAIGWIIKDKVDATLESRSVVHHPWTPYIMSSLVLTFFLFRFGEQDGFTDQLGIAMLYAQIVSLVWTNLTVYTQSKHREDHE